jgi:hypothetical protein
MTTKSSNRPAIAFALLAAAIVGLGAVGDTLTSLMINGSGVVMNKQTLTHSNALRVVSAPSVSNDVVRWQDMVGSTGGLVRATITNGLVTATVTNGLVTAAITNGLGGGSSTNGLASIAYVDGATNALGSYIYPALFSYNTYTNNSLFNSLGDSSGLFPIFGFGTGTATVKRVGWNSIISSSSTSGWSCVTNVTVRFQYYTNGIAVFFPGQSSAGISIWNGAPGTFQGAASTNVSWPIPLTDNPSHFTGWYQTTGTNAFSFLARPWWLIEYRPRP